MKKLIMIMLVCIVGGCPLMERPYVCKDSICLSSRIKYEYTPSNVTFTKDSKTIIGLVEDLANRYGFTDYTHSCSSSSILRSYSRSEERGGYSITIDYYKKDNLICTIMTNGFELSEEYNKMVTELYENLSAMFESDRIEYDRIYGDAGCPG